MRALPFPGSFSPAAAASSGVNGTHSIAGQPSRLHAMHPVQSSGTTS
jgi:hypothetical protein